jgi:hypothetical protein
MIKLKKKSSISQKNSKQKPKIKRKMIKFEIKKYKRKNKFSILEDEIEKK